MKIRAGFMMREVAGKFVAVPVGAGAGDFKGMLQTNKNRGISLEIIAARTDKRIFGESDA